MAVAEYYSLDKFQPDPEAPGVAAEQHSQAGIEEKLHGADIDREGQTMLGQEPAPAGRVINQYRYAAIGH
jgi:hypothetical protein